MIDIRQRRAARLQPSSAARALLWLTCSAVFATGCYRYQPVAVADVREGESVRLDLSAVAVDRVRRGSAEEARVLSGFNVTGKVAKLGADTLTLTVEHDMFDANARPLTINQDLRLLRTEVQGVKQRRLDRKRSTWTGVALGSAIVVSTIFAIQRGGRSTGGNPYNPTPPEIRIPFSLGWLAR
ncbi:MAG: hypothetical protein H7066_03555 [Cytophagaceae bacterium]|nr:hypothetical protein [Gemmatimonadaceae bacterium]